MSRHNRHPQSPGDKGTRLHCLATDNTVKFLEPRQALRQKPNAAKAESQIISLASTHTTIQPPRPPVALPSELWQHIFRYYYKSGALRIGDSSTSATIWCTSFGNVRGAALIKAGRDANFEHEDEHIAMRKIRSGPLSLKLMTVSRKIREGAISAFCKEVTLFIYQVHDAEALTEAIKCLPVWILQGIEKITHYGDLGFKADLSEKCHTQPIFSFFSNLQTVHLDFRADDYWLLRTLMRVNDWTEVPGVDVLLAVSHNDDAARHRRERLRSLAHFVRRFVNSCTDWEGDVEKTPFELTVLVPIVLETQVHGMTRVRRWDKGVLLNCGTGVVLPGLHDVVRKKGVQGPSKLWENDHPGPKY